MPKQHPKCLPMDPGSGSLFIFSSLHDAPFGLSAAAPCVRGCQAEIWPEYCRHVYRYFRVNILQMPKRTELIGKRLQEREMGDAAVEVVERIGSPRNLTFEPHDRAVLAKCWYLVARSDQLGDKPVQTQLLRRSGGVPCHGQSHRRT
jgi:hypothetical protein